METNRNKSNTHTPNTRKQTKVTHRTHVEWEWENVSQNVWLAWIQVLCLHFSSHLRCVLDAQTIRTFSPKEKFFQLENPLVSPLEYGKSFWGARTFANDQFRKILWWNLLWNRQVIKTHLNIFVKFSWNGSFAALISSTLSLFSAF